MRTRMTVTAAVLGAFALPLVSAPSATAASPTASSSAPLSAPAAASQPCERPGRWVVGTKAVTVRSKATTSSTAVGILYDHHTFTVHKTSGAWHYITDRTTGVKGWVSAKYVYRTVRMCLN
ncbi:SH3 domain-containing protein [Streptomyces sp. NPDC006798]|uniref:SH3 domain-containing protein n=1 Tax=Streptomyces sp. NPDC006798 TaxID=3155462 RepID=UPI0033FBCECA